jgi:hypothetical protein
MDADDPTRYTALQSLDSNLSISICSHVQQQSGLSLLPVRCGATVIGGGTHIGGVYPSAHDACRIAVFACPIPVFHYVVVLLATGPRTRGLDREPASVVAIFLFSGYTPEERRQPRSLFSRARPHFVSCMGRNASPATSAAV